MWDVSRIRVGLVVFMVNRDLHLFPHFLAGIQIIFKAYIYCKGRHQVLVQSYTKEIFQMWKVSLVKYPLLQIHTKDKIYSLCDAPLYPSVARSYPLHRVDETALSNVREAWGKAFKMSIIG